MKELGFPSRLVAYFFPITKGGLGAVAVRAAWARLREIETLAQNFAPSCLSIHTESDRGWAGTRLARAGLTRSRRPQTAAR